MMREMRGVLRDTLFFLLRFILHAANDLNGTINFKEILLRAVGDMHKLGLPLCRVQTTTYEGLISRLFIDRRCWQRRHPRVS